LLGFVVIVAIGLMIVNYFRTNDQGQTFPEGSSTQTEGEHTVTKGETLWTIAEEYYGDGYRWVDIVDANNIASANNITEGQILVIPAENTEDPEPVAQNEVLAQNMDNTSGAYTVQRGDNLWTIAEEYYGDGYRWVDISRENGLVNPRIIHTGNVLVMPQ